MTADDIKSKSSKFPDIAVFAETFYQQKTHLVWEAITNACITRIRYNFFAERVITPPPSYFFVCLFVCLFVVCLSVCLFVYLFIYLFICQQHYEKTAGPICMKFSGKVWSDHGTTWFNFGSIRVNGSAGQRSICLLFGSIVVFWQSCAATKRLRM